MTFQKPNQTTPKQLPISSKISTSSKLSIASKLNINNINTIAAPLRQTRIPGWSKPLTTPQVYRAAMYWIVGSTVLLTGAIAAAVMSQRSALKSVGFDTAPSIYYAQAVRDRVASLDGDVINTLLIKPGQNQQIEKDIQKSHEVDKAELSKRLTLLAKNITIPDEERLISTLILQLNSYTEKAQEAKTLHSQGKDDEALIAYRQAQEIVDKILMPSAQELDQLNDKQLDVSYRDSNRKSQLHLLNVVLLGILVIGSLIGCQILLAKWTKRWLNPGLLGATFFVSIFLVNTLTSLVGAGNNLKLAKEDAFDSIYELRKSRSLIYSLNTDESRYILDLKMSAEHQEQFFDKVRQLLFFPNGSTPDQSAYISQLSQLIDSQSTDPNPPSKTSLGGYFAEQLRNITFPGEKDATLKMMQDFLSYLKIDRDIRAINLQMPGKRNEAIELDLGKSDQVFDQFRNSHKAIIGINVKAFDKAISTGLSQLDVQKVPREILAVESIPAFPENGLDLFWIKALLLTGTIVGFTIYGLRSRIAEYE